MVTRTIVTTKVNVLCLDIQSAEPFNKVVTLPRTYKDEKKLLKKVEEVVNTDDVKAVHVVDKEEVEGIDEDELMMMAIDAGAEDFAVEEDDGFPFDHVVDEGRSDFRMQGDPFHRERA